MTPEIEIPLNALPPLVRDHVLSLSLRDNCPPAQTMVALLKVAAQRQLAPLPPSPPAVRHVPGAATAEGREGLAA